MATPAESPAAILAIADRLTPAMRRAFLAAVRRLQGRISVAELARAAARGQLTVQIDRALDAWPADLRNAVAVVNQAFVQAGATAARNLPGGLRTTTSFDLTNPYAVEAARSRTAFLVREITAQQRVALQGVITRAIVDGIPPERAARLIRPLVGLTERQMHAVMNHQSALVVEGLSIDRAQAAAERYAARLHRERAMAIARTELVRSSNDGQLALWHQAQDDGLIGDGARKRWITATDERVCPTCFPMHGVEVLLDEDFPGGVQGPPLHVQCRCSMRLLSAGVTRRRAA